MIIQSTFCFLCGLSPGCLRPDQCSTFWLNKPGHYIVSAWLQIKVNDYHLFFCYSYLMSYQVKKDSISDTCYCYQ